MKKLTALLLAFVMVLSLAACGGDTGNNASTPNNSDNANQSTEANNTGDTSEPAETGTDSESVEPITLRIAYMPNYASLWGVLSAMNTGAFEEEGITVELWEFADGPSEIAAHTLCIQGRALVFAPSSVHTSDKIVVTAESGIESIEDLAGKRIAYNSGSSSESTLQSALSQAGLTEDDVELFDMDVSYMVSAMVSGTVDVAVAWNPYTTEILNQVEGAKDCPTTLRKTTTSWSASPARCTRAWITAPTPTTGSRSPSGALTRPRPAWRPTWPRPATPPGLTAPL